MTKMRIFILCTLFALAWSRPSEQQDENSSEQQDKNSSDTDEPDRSRLVGFQDACRNIRPYAKSGKTVVTRFRFCWNEPGWEADKRMSENAARAWQRVANLSMVFLDNCNNRDAGVTPIYIRDARPIVMPAFKNCKFKAAYMVLNFKFSKKSGYGWCTTSIKTREKCVKFIAMHEMGHAIGFRHEQDHRDSRCNKDRNFGIYNLETRYDTASIMNYCNDKVWVDPHLSPLDIYGVRKVYGKR